MSFWSNRGRTGWFAGKLGIQIGGPYWLNCPVFDFIGACILIFATKLIYPDKWRT